MTVVSRAALPDVPWLSVDLDLVPGSVGEVRLEDGALVLSKRGGGRFTIEDFEQIPDNGQRWELVEGRLVVSPTPRVRHQRAVTQLFRILDAAVPPGWAAFPVPFDVRAGSHTALEPDLLVVPADIADDTHWADPLLVVEVLSPSTSRRDLVTKRRLYARRGVPAYWIVDVDPPSVTVLERSGEGLVEVATVTGTEVLRVERPFPVTLVPAGLVAR
jgi:Uma2 family endonuclease